MWHSFICGLSCYVVLSRWSNMKSAQIFLILALCCSFAGEFYYKKWETKINFENIFTSLLAATQTTQAPNSTLANVDDMEIQFYHLNTSEHDSHEKRISLRQRRGPCACLDLNCGCCAGMEIQKFKRKCKLWIFLGKILLIPNLYHMSMGGIDWECKEILFISKKRV